MFEDTSLHAKRHNRRRVGEVGNITLCDSLRVVTYGTCIADSKDRALAQQHK